MARSCCPAPMTRLSGCGMFKASSAYAPSPTKVSISLFLFLSLCHPAWFHRVQPKSTPTYTQPSSIPASISAQPGLLTLLSSLAADQSACRPLAADVPLDTCVFSSLGVWSLVLWSRPASGDEWMMRFRSDSDTSGSVVVLIREHVLSASHRCDRNSPSKEQPYFPVWVFWDEFSLSLVFLRVSVMQVMWRECAKRIVAFKF